MIRVTVIKPEEVVPVRHRVLRQGMPVEACCFDGDEAETTFHLGGYMGDFLVGVSTFIKEPFPGEDEPAYRLRGMAVLPENRKEGIGTLMLLTGEDKIRNWGIEKIWCDARVGAVTFYEKYFWEKIGDVFEIPTAGPHYRMTKDLSRRYCCRS